MSSLNSTCFALPLPLLEALTGVEGAWLLSAEILRERRRVAGGDGKGFGLEVDAVELDVMGDERRAIQDDFRLTETEL